MRVISAVRHGEENERQFYEALIRLIEDQPAELIDGNPYRAHLERVHAAICQWEASGCLPAFGHSGLHRTTNHRREDHRTEDHRLVS